MDLTASDLKSLQKQCDDLSHLIKDIFAYYNHYNDEASLFKGRSDYAEALKVCAIVPQDFYFFRCFDVFIQLVYHKSLKHYHVIVKGWCHADLNKFTRYKDSVDRFIVGDDFGEALLVYKRLVSLYLREQLGELF